MVLNRGSSRRELARVGICGNNKEDKNKDVNKDGKENKDKTGDMAVPLPLTPYNFYLSPIT